jgi:hypothetical protein
MTPAEKDEYIKILEDRLEIYEDPGYVPYTPYKDIKSSLAKTEMFNKNDLINIIVQKERRIRYLSLRNKRLMEQHGKLHKAT